MVTRRDRREAMANAYVHVAAVMNIVHGASCTGGGGEGEGGTGQGCTRCACATVTDDHCTWGVCDSRRMLGAGGSRVRSRWVRPWDRHTRGNRRPSADSRWCTRTPTY